MNKSVSVELEELFPIIKEKLSLGGSFKFSPKGVSMLPIIRPGIDSVTISPVNRKLKKYDVPLYRRDNGQFVLHRVISVKKNSYVMCGDNQLVPEYNISDRHIIGLVTSIHRPDGIIYVNDDSYVNYAKDRVKLQRKKGIFIRLKINIKRMLNKMHILKGAKG